ncbi:unnamed protein product [Arabidopsis lyrata]|nr:unnamed protein product [Arabidopsis lyrata]
MLMSSLLSLHRPQIRISTRTSSAYECRHRRRRATRKAKESPSSSPADSNRNGTWRSLFAASVGFYAVHLAERTVGIVSLIELAKEKKKLQKMKKQSKEEASEKEEDVVTERSTTKEKKDRVNKRSGFLCFVLLG